MSERKQSRSAAKQKLTKKELTALKIKWVLQVTANQKCLHRLAPAVVNMMAFEWYNEGRGYAYPGIDHMARVLGAGRTGVKQAIASLERHGHLLVQRRGYKPSHYRWNIKDNAENCDAVIEDDRAVVGRKPSPHEEGIVGRKPGPHEEGIVGRKPGPHDENTVGRKSAPLDEAHEDEIVQGDVSRKPDPHEEAGEDRKKAMWAGNPALMWAGNPPTNPMREPYQGGERALRRAPPSLRSAPAGVLTSDLGGDNSTGGAKEEERARPEGARSPSATVRGKEYSPSVPVPTSAPEKEHPHPQTPSPGHACFEDFMAVYPACWPGADDPSSGEFIDEWDDAEHEWEKCEASGDDMAAVLRGAQEFAWHVTVQIERNGDAVNSWAPSKFLEEELWKRPDRWARAGVGS